MTQLHLFPPPASPSKPLSDEVRREVRDLLADLLIAVIVASAEKRQPQGKDGHE